MEVTSDSTDAQVPYWGAVGTVVQSAASLSFVEYRTATIYRACDSSLATLDHVRNKLIEAAGMTAVDALVTCKLAPLSSRRDMALLGLIHRMVWGKGPRQFRFSSD